MAADRWSAPAARWRDPHQVMSWWSDAAGTDPALLRHRTRGPFWELVDELGLTLLVTREYEHLVMSLAPGRRVGFLALPHPSGLAIGADAVHVAATRNPNQLVELRPLNTADRPLVPVRSRWLPGALYLHDLAFIGGRLHANAVGQDAVVTLDYDTGWERVWWPRVIDGLGFERNHLQLNSIAAGADLAGSYFSAATDTPSARRPGHRNFAVDGRGVVFSGATRAVVGRGLTRPHSARILDGRLWVDNSGYGEVGVIEDGRFVVVARLPGWTRGLASAGGRLWVATSRVIPRFRRHAPGLDVDRSVCGLHAVDPSTGTVEASLIWPAGNQVFAVEALPRSFSMGLPFTPRTRQAAIRAMASTLPEFPS